MPCGFWGQAQCDQQLREFLDIATATSPVEGCMKATPSAFFPNPAPSSPRLAPVCEDPTLRANCRSRRRAPNGFVRPAAVALRQERIHRDGKASSGTGWNVRSVRTSAAPRGNREVVA
ncbi:MAG: hypothetical protein BJ554DRAFT_4565 [Olpidium bornovanus]|uniref:Uncharacterized protein n=1 Tax=Olpidium bornovanus TaxID=278681 RepID=A0A8H7ZLY2_9FUNG|nr:MAG: hypothetical protein BJ554DRAFT_4565 [Olpidium bornovanus]